MKVYVTQYATTRGIVEMEGEDVGNGIVRVKLANGCFTTYYRKPHWHADRAQAVERARLVVIREIQNLRKRINKLGPVLEALNKEYDDVVEELGGGGE